VGTAEVEVGGWRLEVGDGVTVTAADRGRGRRVTKNISKMAKAMTGMRIFMAIGA